MGGVTGRTVANLIRQGATGAQLNDVFGQFIERITPDEAWIEAFEKSGVAYADFIR